MFDIGFAELLIIAVVGLLVIGPERLPGAIRTGSAWLNRFRRGFNDIKQEVQQELHNDAVLRDLRESGEKLRRESESLQRDFTSIGTDDSATGRGTTRDPGTRNREGTGENDDLSAADQSAGHRETPAPSMRSNAGSDASEESPDGALHNRSGASQAVEATGADDGSKSEQTRETGGREA